MLIYKEVDLIYDVTGKAFLIFHPNFLDKYRTNTWFVFYKKLCPEGDCEVENTSYIIIKL